MYKLVISDDEGKTTVVPLVRDEVTIGREDGNTIRLTERNVSRRHARLARVNGALTVEDLSSYNGVKVNGEKIGGQRMLSAGDQVSIGDYLLALQVDQPDAASQQPTASVSSPAGGEVDTAMIRAPSDMGPPARLVMLSEPAPGAEFAVSRNLLRIGRAEDLDAWVNHRSISREHAELARVGDDYRIQDLDSANGIRVNGKEIERATIEDGDVIELGQVVFRFVGEGERYQFDPSHTVTIDGPEGSAPLPRFALVIGIGIIAVAFAVAVIFAISPPSGPTATDEPRGIEENPNATVEQFGEALNACSLALGSGDFDTAITEAERALSIQSNSLHAERCLTEARSGARDSAIFRRGCDELAAGDYDKAVRTFSSLPEGSFFQRRTEIMDAQTAWVQQRIGGARDAARTDPNKSRRLASEVLGSSFASTSQRAEARRILERLASDAAAGTRTPGPTPGPRPSETSMQTQAQGGSPMSRCREQNPGLGAGFNACLIQNLRRPRTPSEFETLVEAHRAQGNHSAACRYMSTYQARFPTARRAPAYRQIINQQCN